ncbi:hypothetical protein [Pseudopontixanthobacter vadosimaris]|uniref:hypothetical protein n=1 Tax=Pseudopontixanthobacter vadosimaris TaxID=2726450 RepID=UPI00147311A6|nr:hypothetical protein [Pseudopontixanthobacter vadosimaris]
MKNLILAGAAALAMGVMPAAASAQTSATMSADAFPMNQMQQQTYMDWADENRTDYQRWDRSTQEYFWSLTPQQREGWWALNAEQRSRVLAMTPQQRTQAWASIEAQMNGATPPMANNMATNRAGMNTSAMNSNARINYVSNATVQNIPAPHQGEYPICSNNRSDNCMNPWEAGRRGPGVDRPLNYFPGEAGPRSR